MPRYLWSRFALVLAALSMLGTLALPSAAGASDETHDQDNDPTPSIVGGEPVEWSELPFMAQLRQPAQWVGTKLLCGGTVISASWVLTAAHCVDDENLSEVRVHTVGGTFAIGRVVIHPDKSDRSHAYDIALIQLAGTLSDSAVPIELNSDPGNAVAGVAGMVAGWGEPDVFSLLHRGSQQVYTDDQCATQHKQFERRDVRETMLCGGDATTIPCKGDSGGPFFVERESSMVQIGVVSFGRACNPVYFVGYGDVQVVRDWIATTTDEPRFLRAWVNMGPGVERHLSIDWQGPAGVRADQYRYQWQPEGSDIQERTTVSREVLMVLPEPGPGRVRVSARIGQTWSPYTPWVHYSSAEPPSAPRDVDVTVTTQPREDDGDPGLRTWATVTWTEPDDLDGSSLLKHRVDFEGPASGSIVTDNAFQRSVELHDLPPGDYTVSVTANTRDGGWGHASSSHPFTIDDDDPETEAGTAPDVVTIDESRLSGSDLVIEFSPGSGGAPTSFLFKWMALDSPGQPQANYESINGLQRSVSVTVGASTPGVEFSIKAENDQGYAWTTPQFVERSG